MIGSRPFLGIEADAPALPALRDAAISPVAAPNLNGPRIDPHSGRPQWHDTGLSGVWQRAGEALRQPGVSGSLMRAAGALFAGEGLGGAIGAGSAYADQQRREQQAQQQQQTENEFAKLTLFMRQQQAERDAAKTHYQVVPEGGTMVAFKGDGSLADPGAAAPFVNGGGSAPAAASSGPPRVSNPADYARLPPGAEFITPDGARRRKGGAPAAGGGTFPWGR